jgi:hypothetical protein
MTKYRAVVVFEVEIEIDEAKFDKAFMAEFSESFFPFFDIEDHVKHLAQLQARELLDDFTEGYGTIKDMGIRGETLYWDVEDVSVKEPVSAPEART